MFGWLFGSGGEPDFKTPLPELRERLKERRLECRDNMEKYAILAELVGLDAQEHAAKRSYQIAEFDAQKITATADHKYQLKSNDFYQSLKSLKSKPNKGWRLW